ncbi:MAG: hypothetical protein IKT67_00215 [Lachnospiraceae bacterium]|nr:hypothetical protein [Lachnospiraceae bacterium]
MSKVKKNNYVYQSKKEETSGFWNKKLCFLLAAIVVVIVGVVALICVEKGMRNKLVVNNRSSHNITGLEFWYEDANGDYIDIMALDSVAAKEKVTKSTEDLALSELTGEAWLSIQIKFEDGGEALLQTGQFLYGFDGKISFELADTKDEEVLVRIKAGEGLFNSTTITGCDDVYYINPKDGYTE